MKNFLVLNLLVTILMGCSTKNQTKIIPYLLYKDTEESIYNKMSTLNDKKKVVFYLEHLPNSLYKVYLIDGSDKTEFASSNRKLFINDKFYPLILDTDYYFYTKMKDDYPLIVNINEKTFAETDIKIPSIDERIKNPNAYAPFRKTLIIDNSFYWIIDTKGKLVDTNSEK